MRIDNGIVQLGWFDLNREDALLLDMPQAARFVYEVFVIGLFGVGFTLMVRGKV